MYGVPSIVAASLDRYFKIGFRDSESTQEIQRETATPLLVHTI